MIESRGVTEPVMHISDDEFYSKEELEIMREIKSKVESVFVPSFEELNDNNRTVSAIQSTMDSIYGKDKVVVKPNEENASIVNIEFIEPVKSQVITINVNKGDIKNDNIK